MIKHLVIDQARRWLSDPHNRDRLKEAGRSAWQAYRDSRDRREQGDDADKASAANRGQSAPRAGRSRNRSRNDDKTD